MILLEDLEHVFAHTQTYWEAIRNQRIFLTGGTGFFGCWLLPTFVDANRRLGLNAEMVVLTRNPEAFRTKMPAVADDPAISFITGDVRDFSFPEGGFPFVIHAATDASAKLNTEEPLRMLDVVADGTRRTLEFARHCGARRFLLTSSGAVYGRLPEGMTHMAETYTGGPDTMAGHAAYAEGKRYAETLTAMSARAHGFDAVIVRSFAVVGPYLPLDIHFAMGNFIRDALRGGPIVVAGDGTPRRSYLYGSDLAIWLWTMLFRGETCRPYNMGSDIPVSIKELADLIAECIPGKKIDVEVRKTPVSGQTIEWYVPSVDRAASELNLRPLVPLRDGILKTIAWYREQLS